jgi:hypothetical protein
MKPEKSIGRCAPPFTRLGLVLLLVAAALALLPTLTTRADDYVVTHTGDSGHGSLRQAILDANGNPGHDLITFSPGVSGTIVLSATLPPHRRRPDHHRSRR